MARGHPLYATSRRNPSPATERGRRSAERGLFRYFRHGKDCRLIPGPIRACGEMSEWLKEHDWKSCRRLYRLVGSNPTLSAIFPSRSPHDPPAHAGCRALAHRRGARAPFRARRRREARIRNSAAKDDAKPKPAAKDSTAEPVVTHHQITVSGKAIKYTVTTGKLPIKNDTGRDRSRDLLHGVHPRRRRRARDAAADVLVQRRPRLGESSGCTWARSARGA